MRKTDNEMTGHYGFPVDSKTGEKVIFRDELDYFYVCGTCGQAVDRRDFGEVFHHEKGGHRPLPNHS